MKPVGAIVKKKAVAFFILAVSTVFALTACHKTAPAEPLYPTATPSITGTYTATPTFTVTSTVTPTITPNDSPMLFGFEGGSIYGWAKDPGAPATSYLYPSAAQFYSGSQSLGVACAYSAGDGLVQVTRSFEGFPINLSGKNLSFFVYLSTGMLAAGTFHTEANLVNYDGTTVLLGNGPDILSPGWYQASFAVPSAAYCEMIKNVNLDIRDTSGGSYGGSLYIDDISW
jgi:hypothetical protein